ncbi:MAG TPA: hypothetical protein VFO42_04920 [Sphingomicrobium sp.]|nr:hypothetical protein [Sphingomicrobium sp.]
MTISKMLFAGSAGVAMLAAAAPAAAQYGYPSQGTNGGNVVSSIINSVLGGGRYGTYGQGNDRIAVDQCARAAEIRANSYAPNAYGQQGYGQQGYGYQNNDPRYGQQAYGQAGASRVVAVTRVERRSNGLRVSGLLDTNHGYDNRGYGAQNAPGYGYPGQAYGDPRYPQQGYAQNGDPRYGGWNNQGYANAAQFAELRFNCRVDARGQITRLTVERNNQYRRNY